MNIEEIRNICLSLKGVEESIKWENHLCFTVGDKMFFIVNPDNFPVNGSFKTTPDIFEELTNTEGFTPAPYLARYNWVQYDSIERFNSMQWEQYIKTAYTLIFEKLPHKTRKQIEK